MTRFAVSITAIEVLLTMGAALVIALTEPPDHYLPRETLEELGMKVSAYRTDRRVWLGALPRFTTYAKLKDPERELHLSVRINASEHDYDLHRQRALNRVEQRDGGIGVLVDNPFPGERGYAMRFTEKDRVRVELARARGDKFMVLQLLQKGVRGARARIAVAACERRARLAMGRMMERLGWRH